VRTRAEFLKCVAACCSVLYPHPLQTHVHRLLYEVTQTHIICILFYLCSLKLSGQFRIPEHTTMHCNTPQHNATYCKTLRKSVIITSRFHTLQHSATHRKTLQNSAALYNTLQTRDLNRGQFHSMQRNVTHYNTRQHTASHCNALQHTATLCNTLQHLPILCNKLQKSPIISGQFHILQHTATFFFCCENVWEYLQQPNDSAQKCLAS